MVLTEQSERVTQMKKAAEMRAAKNAEAEIAQVQAGKEAKKEYNKDHMVHIITALIAAEKGRLLDIPSQVNKAKQILDYIDE